MIRVGSDFSGVGAFNQALIRLGIEYKEVFACDMDKYARQTYIHNYGEPEYYPTNVYEREIPSESLDIYMTSPPCQAFSLAGKRLGKKDKRGILFFSSLEFIQVNNPKYFIFENVKGLLSDDGGKTFSEWINLLGGKSINGNVSLFPYPDSVPYHLYWQVLNAKNHGVPQNRERVFLVGIRDDEDNNFRFPIKEQLKTRLKDVLEDDVEKKYFLSDKMINYISSSGTKNFYYKPELLTDNSEFVKPITTEQDKRAGTTNYLKIKSATSEGYEESTEEDSIPVNQSQEVIVHNIPEMVKVRKHEVDIVSLQNCLKEHRTKSIKEIATELNVPKTEVEHWFRTDKYFGIPNAEIWFDLKKCLNITTTDFDLSITEFIEKESVFEKSNRVYDEDGLAPTITSTGADERILVKNDFQQDEEIWIGDFRNDEGLRIRKDNISPCMAARKHSETDVSTMPPIIGALFHWGKGKNNERMVYDKDGISPCMISAMGMGGGYTPSVIIDNTNDFNEENKRVYDKYAPSLRSERSGLQTIQDYKIRRLTPRECFRLMDFPDTFDFSVVSDSQAYRQAGNSIVVNVLYKILLQITKKLII